MLARLVTTFGRRGYALPVLVVVTMVIATIVITTTVGFSIRLGGHGSGRRTGSSTSTRVAAPAATATLPATTLPTLPAPIGPTSTRVKVDSGGQSEDVDADELPPGPAYTKRGTGMFRALAGTTKPVGRGARVRRYVIEVEDGVTGVDLDAYATLVDRSLDAPKGWTGGNHTVTLQRVSAPNQADFRIALTSSLTLRPPCGHLLNIETSCWDNDHGPSRVYLNVARWVRGDTQFGQDLAAYRVYMINHEVGHALGHVHTYTCLPNGLAPVMMQQTITLKENQGKGPKICQPNVWPYPVDVDPRVAVPT